MTPPLRPSPLALQLLAATTLAALVLLIAGVPVPFVARLVAAAITLQLLATVVDYLRSRRSWRAAPPALSRKLPAAFAIGVRKDVGLVIDNASPFDWRVELHDHLDPTLHSEGPLNAVTLPAASRFEIEYAVVPSRRGLVRFEPAHLRVRSRWRLCEMRERLGPAESRRVYPDFGQIARYAWLAGDRRLQEIGIKTYQQRGEGTDFKQLSEYRHGDPVRHIDWKATRRLGKPVVREFQDERDQCVLLLVDCGRRMRADDRTGGIGTAHFDQVLNAVMLLSYVALQQGDAVGAMTFGTPASEARTFAPRKGRHTLHSLMSVLYALQPSPTHSDYVSAAQEALRRYLKRALVVIVTNFRDEDSDELQQALRLLRTRHLVLLASLRERIVGEMLAAPLHGNATFDVASAHAYEQGRRDAFARLAARDALMVDAEPERLGIELVNRYHAAKRAGLI